ncbi:MAG: TrbC/VirB2 family protein [Patescibacteria group bacterium]|nr:TrbC/VirB2 family protein [Patescibacteria group bacterium]
MKNKKRFFSAIVAFSVVFLFVSASAALAYTSVGPGSIDDITKIITRVVNWFQVIVLLLGVMMIAWAGFTWMTAGGEEEKLKEARQRLIWGLVGIGVALFAGAAEGFITDLLTNKS